MVKVADTSFHPFQHDVLTVHITPRLHGLTQLSVSSPWDEGTHMLAMQFMAPCYLLPFVLNQLTQCHFLLLWYK